MSLLSTSSTTQQEAYLYENHYPQPIVVKPNSQICLQKFIHYRGALYEVSTQNNTIGFRLGTGGANADVARFTSIPVGTYEGADLADAVSLALNSVNQQQNYEWLCTFTPAPTTNDTDIFQIQYSSVPTPDPRSGQYNKFSSGQIAVSGENQINKEAKITYNGTNADHFANVISKKSTLVYLGEQTWNMIQPNVATEEFEGMQFGLVRNKLSNPNDPNPNLQFKPNRMDIAFECSLDNMIVSYGRQRQGSVVGAPNWFQSDTRRDLGGAGGSQLFDAVFKPGGTFSPHTKLQCKISLYASAQTQRRVLIQLFKKERGETTYTALADGLGGNGLNGQPLIKTSTFGTDTFAGLCFDSDDGTLNDTNTAISALYPKLSQAPFFPCTCFAEEGNVVLTGYELDEDTWTNTSGATLCDFTELANNSNGFNWRSSAVGGSAFLNDVYWKQIDATSFECMRGDVPLTDPPQFTAQLDPTGGAVNPRGQIRVFDTSTGGQVQEINFDGANPVAEVSGASSIFTQGIFNTTEPQPGLQGTADEETEGAEGGGLGVDLSSNARIFLRGAGGGVEADVANLLGFSQNEDDFGGGSATGASITSDQEPEQTANNNTLHISIPEMPLVKSFEGENSAEGKSIAIIPREEFATGETEGSLVYVAPFENWIDINNGQELNVNLITTIIRNADGSLAENLVRETQAIFKIREDPTKVEEERKAEKFKEMAEMMANTINTGLTSLIKPQQLIGS